MNSYNRTLPHTNTTLLSLNSTYGFIKYYEEDKIIISGKFIGKEAQDHHRLVVETIKSRLEHVSSLSLHFNYQYFDTSVLVYILKMVKLMNTAYTSNKQVSITWKFELDEDMIDVGTDLRAFCAFDFDIPNERINYEYAA